MNSSMLTVEIVYDSMFKACHSINSIEQQQAMKDLQSYESRGGYSNILLQLIEHNNHMLTQQASNNDQTKFINFILLCVICLKNLVVRSWVQRGGSSGNSDVLTKEDKHCIKNFLCSWAAFKVKRNSQEIQHNSLNVALSLWCDHPKITTQLYVIVRRIARHDWPLQWPNLLPLLHGEITSNVEDESSRRCKLRCLHVLNNILKELSSKKLSVAKAQFCAISIEIYGEYFAMWKCSMDILSQQLATLHRHNLNGIPHQNLDANANNCNFNPLSAESINRLHYTLQCTCLLTDMLYLLLNHGLKTEWMQVHGALLPELFTRITQLCVPSAPTSHSGGGFGYLETVRSTNKLIRHMKSFSAPNADCDEVSSSSCCFVFYDEESSELILEETGGYNCGAGAELREYSNAEQYLVALLGVANLLNMLTSQLYTLFPAMQRQHPLLVGEYVVPFLSFYGTCIQTEIAPSSKVNGADTALSRATELVCSKVLSDIRHCGVEINSDESDSISLLLSRVFHYGALEISEIDSGSGSLTVNDVSKMILHAGVVAITGMTSCREYAASSAGTCPSVSHDIISNAVFTEPFTNEILHCALYTLLHKTYALDIRAWCCGGVDVDDDDEGFLSHSGCVLPNYGGQGNNELSSIVKASAEDYAISTRDMETEKSSLRVAAENLFLSLLEMKCDLVTQVLFEQNPLLRPCSGTTNSTSGPSDVASLMQVYLMSCNYMKFVGNTSSNASPDEVVSRYNHILLSLDNWLMCLGLGVYHFGALPQFRECWFFDYILLPTLQLLLRNPELGNFIVLTPANGEGCYKGKVKAIAPVIRVRILWCIRCWLYTIGLSAESVPGAKHNTMTKLVELVVLSLLPAARSDIVTIIEACDTLSAMVDNCDNTAAKDPCHVFNVLLQPCQLLAPFLDASSKSNTILSFLIGTLCDYVLTVVCTNIDAHKNLGSASAANTDMVETKRKVMDLIGTLLSHYSTALLMELHLDHLCCTLLHTYISMYCAIMEQKSRGVDSNPELCRMILESITNMIRTTNNNLYYSYAQQQQQSLSIDCTLNVRTLNSVYPTVLQIIANTLTDSSPHQGSSSNTAGEYDQCENSYWQEGLNLWVTLMRTVPPFLSCQHCNNAGAAVTTLDSMLMQLLLSHFGFFFSCDRLNSNSSHHEYRDVFMLLECYLVRYGAPMMDTMLASAENTSPPSLSGNGTDGVAGAMKELLQFVCEKTVCNVLPRSVAVVMRPWSLVLGSISPDKTTRLLESFKFEDGLSSISPSSYRSNALSNIVRACLAHCAFDVEKALIENSGAVGVTGISFQPVPPAKLFLEQHPDMVRSLASAWGEFQEQTSSVIQYLSVLCDLMCEEQSGLSMSQIAVYPTANPNDPLNSSRLSATHRVLYGLVCAAVGNSRSIEQALCHYHAPLEVIDLIVQYCYVGLVRCLIDTFDTLSCTSKSHYYTRRLWAHALISVFSVDVVTFNTVQHMNSSSFYNICVYIHHIMVAELFPLIVVMMDGSMLLEQETASGAETGNMKVLSYHEHLYTIDHVSDKPSLGLLGTSSELCSLTNVLLTKASCTEDIDDDDDEIQEFGVGGSEKVQSDAFSDDWNDGDGSIPDDEANPSNALKDTIVYLMNPLLSNSRAMKNSLFTMLRERINVLCNPHNRRDVIDQTIKISGSSDIFSRFQ